MKEGVTFSSNHLDKNLVYVDLVEKRAFVPMKDAALFLVDYVSRKDAKGNQWGNDRYHIFPSVPHELYGLQPGFKFNNDTQIDITLSKFIFNAYLKATQVLNVTKKERILIKQVKHILTNMPAYPIYNSSRYGDIYVSVPGEKDQIIYNVPANLTNVFPGEEYGIDVPSDVKQRLINTLRAHQNEGGNDLVFLNLQAVRIGMLI